MGDVISIHRHGDNDIYRFFDSCGPDLPDDLDKNITNAAARAVGKKELPESHTFRNVFIAIAGLSLLGVIVGQRIHYQSAIETGNSVPTVIVDTDEKLSVPSIGAAADEKQERTWRQSKQDWQLYIDRMESELHLEKSVFAKRFPG